jgi:glycosyltransferase involved in cell wall biosynthesis
MLEELESMVELVFDKKPLWITWERQVRNRSLSARLDAQLFEMDVAGSWFKRYSTCLVATTRMLWKWRGSLVFVQNPSLVLVLLAVMLRPVLRYRLIMDAHNAGIYPAEGKRGGLQKLADALIRRCDLVIVTNEGLAERVRLVGGQPFILQDPLPKIAKSESRQQQGEGISTALFICTWAADEPYVEVFKAAELTPGVTFFVTGKSKGREKELGRNLSSNVVLTGFVPHDEFERLLTTVDIVIDLTTRQDCLVCGAYEAVSAGTPFLLSDTKALRSYFSSGGVHVSNDANGIAQGIHAILSDYDSYREDIVRLKEILESAWVERKRALVELMHAC